ncbi:hypothetical protein [Kitasatospora sp. NPDC059571]|uniref:hypothetical protein n=1 Tax=Kitasatospora sp. NPDC059571 TaxID=3346871 RepID=UPI00369A0560
MSLAGRARLPIDGRAVARSRRPWMPARELFRGSFPAEEAIVRGLLRELPPAARYVSFNRHLGRATGADLLWWWVEPGGRGFGCLIQVRSLTRHAGIWRIGSDRRAHPDAQLTRLLYTSEHFGVPAALLLHPAAATATADGSAEEAAATETTADDQHPYTRAAGLLPALAVRADLRYRAEEAQNAGLRLGGLDGPELLERAIPFTSLLTPRTEPYPPLATDTELARQGVHRRLRPLLTEPQSGAGAVARTLHHALQHQPPCPARATDGTLLDEPGRRAQFDTVAHLRHVTAGLRPTMPDDIHRALAGHGPSRLARYIAGLIVIPL